jgi:hypothetical protein
MGGPDPTLGDRTHPNDFEVGGESDGRDRVRASETEREWRCVECDFVIEYRGRPSRCPHCNCTDDDTINYPMTQLFVPNELTG